MKKIFVLLILLISPTSETYNYAQTDEVQQLIDRAMQKRKEAKFEDCLILFQEALAKQKELPNAPEIYAKIYYELGRLYNNYAFDEPEKAFVYFEKALKNANQAKDQGLEAYIYFGIGTYYQNQDNDRRTQQYYEKSLAIHKKINNKQGIVIATGDLGNVFLLRGDYQKAIQQYLAAIALCKQDEKKFDVFLPGFHHNIAICYNIMQELAQAIEYETLALAALKKVKPATHPSFLSYYNLLGHIHADKNNLDSAQYYLDKFHEVFGGTPKSALITNYHYQGILDMKKKEYQKSLEHLQKAKALCLEVYGKRHQMTAGVLNDIAHTYEAQQDWDSALSFTQKALIANHQTFENTSLNKNPNFEGIFSNNYFVSDMINKVRFAQQKYLKSKDKKYLEIGLQAVKVALKLIDTTRQAYDSKVTLNFFGEQALKIYQIGMAILFELHQIDPKTEYLALGLEVMEKSRAYQLMRSLNEQEIRQEFTQNPLVNKEDSLSRSINLLKKELEKLDNDSLSSETERVALQKKIFEQTQAKTTLLKDIQKKLPEYYQAKHQWKTITLSEVQKNLAPQAALVTFLEGEEGKMFSMLISKEKISLHSINMSSTEIIDFRKAILNKDKSAYTQKAFKIYQKLWANLALAPHINKVHLITDGSLTYLPFSALIQQKAKPGEGYKNFDYLLKNYVLTYHFSATQAFSKFEQPNPKQNKLIAFAPDFLTQNSIKNINSQEEITRKDLDNLPGAQKEVKTIAKQFDGKVFTQKAANRANFEQYAAKGNILHLATHAIVDDKNPALSRLLLSENYTDDEEAKLYAFELQNMQLGVDLVTLSACNTGLGRIQKGEGVMSLARAFALAGCKNILMSLWAVSDESTSSLMSHFYAFLAEGYSKKESLQLAKLKYLKDSDENGANPYYWAGFVLIGEGNSSHSYRLSYSYWFFGTIGLLSLLGLAYYFFKRRVGSSQ